MSFGSEYPSVNEAGAISMSAPVVRRYLATCCCGGQENVENVEILEIVKIAAETFRALLLRQVVVAGAGGGGHHGQNNPFPPPL